MGPFQSYSGAAADDARLPCAAMREISAKDVTRPSYPVRADVVAAIDVESEPDVSVGNLGLLAADEYGSRCFSRRGVGSAEPCGLRTNSISGTGWMMSFGPHTGGAGYAVFIRPTGGRAPRGRLFLVLLDFVCLDLQRPTGTQNFNRV